MSQTPNQPGAGQEDELPHSSSRHQTIHNHDGIRAGGTHVQDIKKTTAIKTGEVFELPKEVNSEITWKIFHPKIEKAKRMTELSAQLAEDNTRRQLEALDGISDLLGQERGGIISKRKMRQMIIDGTVAVSVLLKSGQIRIQNQNNVIALNHLNGEFEKENHEIEEFDLDLLTSIFNDIHPIIPKIENKNI